MYRNIIKLKRKSNTKSHVWNSIWNVSIRMDWQNYLLKPSEEAVEFPQGFTERMECFINWFAWFPSRLLPTLASITFLCVCVCLWGILSKWSFRAACCISSTLTSSVHRRGNKHTLHTHTHASSSNQWSLNRLSRSLVVMTPKQVDFQLNHTQLWLFLFWFGICSARVRDGSLSSSTGGRWCSWGSLINSSSAFISSLMDLVSAYQGFDYLP